MIPDFKTYIGESIWSDMQARGTDDLLKKEESVNSLDIKRFTNYLKNRYSETATTKTTSSQIRLDKGKIYIPLLPYSYNAGYELVFNSKCLDFHDRYHGTGRFPSCLKFLKKNYVFTVFDSLGYSTIYTRLGNTVKTNEEVIEVIDMIIDKYQGEEELMISRKVSESIWTDMEDRGNGDITKKEDDIDFIGGFKLYERLRKMYKYTNATGHIIAYYNDSGLITVPLFVDKGMNLFNIDYFVNSGKVSIYARWYNDARKIFMKLSKKYHIYHPNVSIYHIEPFEGDVTNTFFIEVVDFILSCVEPPYKKVIERNDPVSESVWSDMQERGTGDLEKAEDTIPVEEIEDFIDKSLNIYAELYVQEGWADDGEELTYDIFAEVVKTSDSMTGNMAVDGIDNYEDYTEEQLDKILKYAKRKWNIYSKKLEEYRKEWEDFWNKRRGN